MKTYFGYHGTTKENAQNIIENGFNIRRAKWFGEGVYFFLDDMDSAEKWAVRRFKKDISVLESQIKLCEKEVFDLTSPFNVDVKKFHALRKLEISERFIIDGVRKGERRFAHDEVVLNFLFLKKNIKLFLINTYTYQSYDSRDDESLFLSSRVPNGTEMIVKDLEIIKHSEEVDKNETEL